MSKLKSQLLDKALNLEDLSAEEGLFLYNECSLAELAYVANKIQEKLHPENIVSYIIDRNINLSNICVSNCLFCNFCRAKQNKEAYILKSNEYTSKINELFSLGGNQILLQGGIHSDFDLDFYCNLFSELKTQFPELKLHALGPPEVVNISKTSGLSYSEVLNKLRAAGLDSLPGAGAEILSDRVRKIISPNKCSTKEWLDVMEIAHQKGITTSATMMFGHIETLKERLEHFVTIRDSQDKKPKNSKGYISFTIWPLAGKDTRLIKIHPDIKTVEKTEFVKMLSLSRIMLPNIPNIQASWLTMGKETAQVCLHSGANDMSSIMIEENVVSKAGKNNQMGVEDMINTIEDAGFIAKLRNQEYQYL